MSVKEFGILLESLPFNPSITIPKFVDIQDMLSSRNKKICQQVDFDHVLVHGQVIKLDFHNPAIPAAEEKSQFFYPRLDQFSLHKDIKNSAHNNTYFLIFHFKNYILSGTMKTNVSITCNTNHIPTITLRDLLLIAASLDPRVKNK